MLRPLEDESRGADLLHIQPLELCEVVLLQVPFQGLLHLVFRLALHHLPKLELEVVDEAEAAREAALRSDVVQRGDARFERRKDDRAELLHFRQRVHAKHRLGNDAEHAFGPEHHLEHVRASGLRDVEMDSGGGR